MINMNRTKRLLLLTILLYAAIPALLLLTSPDNLPLPLLVLPFLLLFIALYMTSQLITGKFFSHLKTGVRRGLAISLAALPTLLLVLQSVGQLTIRDSLITVGLVVILIVYFKKTDFLS